jgi:hypothetical protein
MYALDDTPDCILYSDACAEATSSTNNNIYAKSGFYSEPKRVTARCTHL